MHTITLHTQPLMRIQEAGGSEVDFIQTENIVPGQSNRILKSQKYIKSHCVCGL